jgi:hypothetical protein
MSKAKKDTQHSPEPTAAHTATSLIRTGGWLVEGARDGL